MRFGILVGGLALLLASLAAPPAPAQMQASLMGDEVVEIRIGLPPGSAPASVAPGQNEILLELPRGAEYPTDFEQSSGGLLRQAEVTEGRDTVVLRVGLARGQLDRVQYEDDGIVLRFQSRRSIAAGTGGNPAEQYTLGPDDRVLVTVTNHPELSSERVLSRDGVVSIPLVGEVKAAGMTPRELASRLAELYGLEYLRNPQVEVEVAEFRSKWVMVAGELRRAGRVPLRGGTRLKEVLSELGGFTERAGETITITRKRRGDEDESVTLEIDRGKFEEGDVNPLLANGDIIEVARADYTYIQGEVRRPGRTPVERGMTLMRVVTLANGFTDWANTKKIQIIYPEGHMPREITVNYNKILKGLTPDPVITGGEVIVVKRRYL